MPSRQVHGYPGRGAWPRLTIPSSQYRNARLVRRNASGGRRNQFAQFVCDTPTLDGCLWLIRIVPCCVGSPSMSSLANIPLLVPGPVDNLSAQAVLKACVRRGRSGAWVAGAAGIAVRFGRELDQRGRRCPGWAGTVRVHRRLCRAGGGSRVPGVDFQEDEIRYRFGDHTAILRRAASDNDVTVEVSTGHARQQTE